MKPENRDGFADVRYDIFVFNSINRSQCDGKRDYEFQDKTATRMISQYLNIKIYELTIILIL